MAAVLAPVIAIGFLPDSAAEQAERVSLMAAGLAIQQKVERPDNIPLAPWGRIGRRLRVRGRRRSFSRSC